MGRKLAKLGLEVEDMDEVRLVTLILPETLALSTLPLLLVRFDGVYAVDEELSARTAITSPKSIVRCTTSPPLLMSPLVRCTPCDDTVRYRLSPLSTRFTANCRIGVTESCAFTDSAVLAFASRVAAWARLRHLDGWKGAALTWTISVVPSSLTSLSSCDAARCMVRLVAGGIASTPPQHSVAEEEFGRESVT
jgi:hypothetical protein